MEKCLITGATICNTVTTFESDLAIENGVIIDVGDLEGNYKHFPKFEFRRSDRILPGFIDVHIHGSNGADIMDGTLSSLKTIGMSLVKQGVTGFLATTMTQSDQLISNALLSVREYIAKYKSIPESSEVLGVHLEGPFISEDKIGAQNPKYLQEISFDKLERWKKISGNKLKKITFAPELDNSSELVTWCSKNNIASSIGHTACTAEQAQRIIDRGASQATHLFNAMSGIDHRNPGAATVLLGSQDILAELIVDKIHLASETIKMTYDIKGSNNILLITDAISAQTKGEGVFHLGGQKVIVKGNEARLENGVLAGSVLTMNKALQNMHMIVQCNFPDLVKMTSTNAAKFLGINNLGDIQVGMVADLVVLDDQYQVKCCLSKGRITGITG